MTFTVKVTDADNDVAQDPHTISITDGANPTSTKNASITVNEEGIDNGNAKGSVNNNSENDSDTVSFQAGSDNITAIAFGDVAGLTVDVNGILGPTSRGPGSAARRSRAVSAAFLRLRST